MRDDDCSGYRDAPNEAELLGNIARAVRAYVAWHVEEGTAPGGTTISTAIGRVRIEYPKRRADGTYGGQQFLLKGIR